jgi:hypothetical protein
MARRYAVMITDPPTVANLAASGGGWTSPAAAVKGHHILQKLCLTVIDHSRGIAGCPFTYPAEVCVSNRVR